MLRLVLMCCHPALAPEVASALALRLVVGVPTADIARLFLVPEPTMAARLTRGKRKIVTAGIPFAVPGASALPARLDTVAQTAYLAFTAGYAPGSGPDLLRADLSGQAVRLVRVTLALCPHEPVLQALLALLLLQHSRRDARTDAAGRLVLLPDQDRSRWHHDEVAEAVALLDRMPSHVTSALAESYRLQALVAAEHATAATASDTRWDRICEHYAALVALNPSPAVRLAAAVALAERDGPAGRARGARRPRRRPAAQPPAAGGARRAAGPGRGERGGRRGPRPGDRALPQRRRARSTSPGAATSSPHARSTEYDDMPPSTYGPDAVVSASSRGPAPAGGAGRPRRPSAAATTSAPRRPRRCPGPAMNPSPPQASTVTSTGKPGRRRR